MPTAKKADVAGNSAEEQRREQNRIISELKMIRLLEMRVHQSTIDVDGKRGEATPSSTIRKRRRRA